MTAPRDRHAGRDFLLAALDAMAAGLRGLHWHGGPPRSIALGWATVELERLSAEFESSGVVTGPFVPSSPDPILGAACRQAGIAGSPVRLIVCEPTTEGRLAASLARLGEGPVAGWFVVDPAGPGEGTGLGEAARGAGIGASSIAEGPLGSEVLVLGGPIAGPHILLVRSPGALP